MMTEMLDFMTGMLHAIAEFLGSEPIIYIVGFILAAVVVKILKTLMN